MEQKRGGRGNKDFKKLDKLVPGVGTLKRGWGGGWNPLTKYGRGGWWGRGESL